MTFPGIFLAGDSENAVFVVVFDFRLKNQTKPEKFVLAKFIITEK
jgi:hypothetical protein